MSRHTAYYPEMGEKRPEAAQIDATMSHYGRHWFLRTPLTLKGRGIEFEGVIKASEMTPQGQHMAGWNRYKVTQRAYDAICEQYAVATVALL